MSKIVTNTKPLNYHEKVVLNILFLYFLSLNVFSIFNLQQSPLANLISPWNMFCLLLMITSLLYVTRIKKITIKYLPIVLVFLISSFLTLWHSFTSSANLSLLLSPSQIFPPVLMLVFLVLSGRLVISKEGLLYFNKLIIAFAVFACFYNIIINFQHIANDLLTISDPYELLLSSFYTNRNSFGFLLAFSLAAIVLNYTSGISFKSKTAYILSFLLIFTNLILTMSRGSILIFVIFFAAYMVLLKGVRGILQTCIYFGILAFATYGILGTEYIQENIIREDAGSTGRDVLQSFGLQIFQSNNLILGSGVEAPVNMLNSMYGFDSFHSTYITLLAEGGVLLLLSYILIYVMSLSSAILIKRSLPEQGSFFIALLVAYIVYGFVEANILFRFDGNSVLALYYIVLLPIYIKNNIRLSQTEHDHAKEFK